MVIYLISGIQRERSVSIFCSYSSIVAGMVSVDSSRRRPVLFHKTGFKT